MSDPVERGLSDLKYAIGQLDSAVDRLGRNMYSLEQRLQAIERQLESGERLDRKILDGVGELEKRLERLSREVRDIKR